MDDELTVDGPCEPPRLLAGAPAAVGEVVAGRWSVSEIRRGGQSWVLMVDDVERGDRRAIKIPRSGSAVGDAELAMLLGLEPHPHVVTALDETSIGGRRGIVLEYTPSTLADLLRQLHGSPSFPSSIGRHTGALRPTEAAPVPDRLTQVLQGVCAGLVHLSKRTEMAHLDIKPSNVLIDDTGNAKIADFGLALQVRIQGGRFPSARGGTWAYAAPEALRQEPCDTRTDIFSFGVLLYQACTGRLPYPFPLASDPATQRTQLLDYYASDGPRERTQELYYWGQGTLTQVPVPPPGEDISIILSSCLQVLRENRPLSFRHLAPMLDAGLRRPPLHTTAVPLVEADEHRRELALSHALLRLGRFGEAVNHLNRLLTAPLPRELFTEVHRTAVDALTAAGRHLEAAALRECR
ncbi:protein kinase domain-containing protein [Kitasatospora acidiphila]|nr:protein kinase [Kitasatospora acidiphila]